MKATVAKPAIAACTQGAASQPNMPGSPSARPVTSGPVNGRLRLDSAANTNLNTTQTSQIGSRVNRPVRK